MESFRAFFLLIFLCSQIFCFEEDMPSLEEDPWTAPSLKDEGLQSSSLQRFAQLVKRGKFQQFYGLMGKRASDSTQDWDNSQPLPAWQP
ncbi:uncharacterized protein LOC102934704 [Chelonia mydas]|uniref:uncharacterized protein LOC102934704 n=1 Tax=Chelonia mydas TaxID=8469 RepID=UPI0018A23903|nr:uncharacterized protein LOC102934704 [Chelonia mydas]